LIDNTYVSQNKKAALQWILFFWGNLTRNNLNFYHFGERIVSYLNGITIIGEAARPLYFGTACYPNCESHQDYRNLFWPFDRCFQRKIYVEKRPKKQTHSKKQ
jgi:Fe-S cluster assembly protein SufD